MNTRITSRAAVTDGRGGFQIDTTEVAAPGPGEVRVKIAASGLCHTDHQSLTWAGPLVMGHEGAGHVEALGEGVTHLTHGAPVLLNWAIPCGHCPQCGRGSANVCDRSMGVKPELGSPRAAEGHTHWRGQTIQRAFNLGTFSEYTLVRAEALTPLPATVPLDRACILGCGVMTGVGSVVNVAKVQPGESVAVVGCGGVGLSTIQGARIAGAGQVIAIDRNPDALARARQFGATHLLQAPLEDPQGEQLLALLKAITDGRGADYAFEATGVHALAFLPLKLVRHGGMALQLSGAHGERTVSLFDFWWDKRYVVPLYGGCQPERDFPRLVDWWQNGQLDLDGMVSRFYGLDELPQALDDLLSGRNIKGVVRFA